MDINQVVTLLNAGFTADEIRELKNRDIPTPEPDITPNPEPAVPPTPEPAPMPVAGSQYSEILSAISDLTAAIQANGIANSNQPQPAHSREDILASIIKPAK